MADKGKYKDANAPYWVNKIVGEVGEPKWYGTIVTLPTVKDLRRDMAMSGNDSANVYAYYIPEENKTVLPATMDPGVEYSQQQFPYHELVGHGMVFNAYTPLLDSVLADSRYIKMKSKMAAYEPPAYTAGWFPRMIDKAISKKTRDSIASLPPAPFLFQTGDTLDMYNADPSLFNNYKHNVMRLYAQLSKKISEGYDNRYGERYKRENYIPNIYDFSASVGKGDREIQSIGSPWIYFKYPGGR